MPLKNSIDQSQEFALCIFALAPLALQFFKQRRLALGAVCAALMLAFFANMMFVALARTALLYMLVLTVLFAVRHLGRRAMWLLFAATAGTVVLVWFASPYLRGRVERVAVDTANTPKPTVQLDRSATGILARVDQTFSEAPLFGNGTGSIKQMFDRQAVGKTGAWADRSAIRTIRPCMLRCSGACWDASSSMPCGTSIFCCSAKQILRRG